MILDAIHFYFVDVLKLHIFIFFSPFMISTSVVNINTMSIKLEQVVSLCEGV